MFHIVYRILIPLKQHILIRTRSVLVVLCSLLCPKESKPRESICVLIQPASDACTVYCFTVLSPQPIWKKKNEKNGTWRGTCKGHRRWLSKESLPTRPIFASVPSCLLAVYKHQIVVANQNKKKIVQSNSCVAVFWLLSCLCIQCVFVFCPNQTTLLRLYLLWILNWLLTGPHLC